MERKAVPDRRRPGKTCNASSWEHSWLFSQRGVAGLFLLLWQAARYVFKLTCVAHPRLGHMDV